MTALIFPVVPAMDDERWQIKRLPALVLQVNGGRVYADHVTRVLRARLVADLAGATESVSALSVSQRAAGGER